jgi:hypothetical protein
MNESNKDKKNDYSKLEAIMQEIMNLPPTTCSDEELMYDPFKSENVQDTDK